MVRAEVEKVRRQEGEKLGSWEAKKLVSS